MQLRETLHQLKIAPPLDQVILVLWGLIFLSLPFRDYDLGFFNVTEWLVAGFVGCTGLKYGPKVGGLFLARPFKWLLFFVVYTLIVNAFYSIHLEDTSFICEGLFYPGAALFMVAAFVLMRDKRELGLTIMAMTLIVTLLILVVYIMLMDNLYKPQAFFSNTNKLSRLVLMSSVLFCILKVRMSHFRSSWVICVLGGAILISWQVMTRGVLVAFVLLLLIMLRQRHFRIVGLSVVFGCMLVGINHWSKGEGPGVQVTHIESRFKESDHEDHIVNRGYGRIWRNPQYLLLGAGEERWERFARYASHSSSATILFGYGIVGFGFLVAYYFQIFRHPGLSVILLLPLIVHGLVHNDMRSIFYWIIPCLFYFVPSHFRS